MTDKLISQTIDINENGYGLTRIHATPAGHVVRIRLYRPSDPHGRIGSTAQAAVYHHAEKEWRSVTALGHDWWDGTADVVSDEAIIDQLDAPATVLYQQACDILSYGPPSPSDARRDVYTYGAQLPSTLARTGYVSPVQCGGSTLAAYTDIGAARHAVSFVNDEHGGPAAKVGDALHLNPPDDELLDLARGVEGQVRVYIQDNDGTTVDLLHSVDRSVGLGMCLVLNEEKLLRPGFTALLIALDV